MDLLRSGPRGTGRLKLRKLNLNFNLNPDLPLHCMSFEDFEGVQGKITMAFIENALGSL